MTWVRIDDQIRQHPKFLRVGGEAGWLWLCGTTYASQYLTDGFIPDDAMPSLFPVRHWKRLARQLVDAGLWHREPSGYRIHDYHDYNPSADTARATQEAMRDQRRAAGRSRAAQAVRTGGRFQRDTSGSAGERHQRAHQRETSGSPPAAHQPRPVPSPDPDPEVVPDRHSVPSSGLANRPTDGDGWTLDDLTAEAPDPFAERVGAFLEAYQQLYREILGARYHVRPAHDAPAARRLCATWSDGRLRQMAELFLKTDEPWIRGTGRTLGVFESRASWCEARLAECGISEEAG